MEKTLTIDNKKVKFKTNGALMLRYRHQFGKDFFQGLAKMSVLGEMENTDELSLEALQGIDFEVFERICWLLAKIADDSIPDMIEWYSSFDVFPIMDVLPEIMDMISAALEGKKKQQENHPGTR